MATTGEPFGLFWDSDGGDRTYSADSFERWLSKFFTSGVFNGDLQVTASSGMTLEVSAGYTNANGKVKFWNAPFNVTLDAANSTYPRIDTVVIRRDNVNRQITCEKVTGQYSGDTPQPTAPTRNNEIFELVLAQIYIPAGSTEVIGSNITDTRPDTSLCGYITGTVEELDFSAFTAQFEAYFAEFKSQHEQEWSVWETAQRAAYAAWFATVQAQQVQDKADWDAWYAALQEELHELPPDTAEYLQIEIDEIKQSGTSGSILNITTTESSLEGKTITVTNGTEVRTGVFDENLECVIAGYKGVGEVTISSSDGIDTATTVVTIPYFGNYTYNIAFWAATVNIQGDDNLKGATITVKDSDNLTVDTVVLNQVTGQGVFTATKADTYTFNFTYQGTDYSESLVVDQQTTYSLSLSAGFAWQTWVDTARFLDSSDYANLGEVLADEEAVRELCLEHNCVDYLAEKITSDSEDAETIIENDLFAKWVNNSDYALDFLYANAVIADLMDESDKYFYGEWVITDNTTTPPTWGAKGNVPSMTSNTMPYGEAFADSTYSTYGAYKAFDGVLGGDPWHSTNSSATHYVGYKFVNPICCKAFSYKQVESAQYPARKVIKLTLRGSNDGGATWQPIYETTDVPDFGLTKTYKFNNSEYYLSLSLLLTLASAEYTTTQYVQFYGRELSISVPTMTGYTTPYGEVVSSGYEPISSSDSTYGAWHAFDGVKSGNGHLWRPEMSGTTHYVGYKFVNPMCVKKVVVDIGSSKRSSSFVVKGSNDSDIWYPLSDSVTVEQTSTGTAVLTTKIVELNNDNTYRYCKLEITSTQDDTWGGITVGELQFYGKDYSEKEFEEGTTKKWLYDHGVELESIYVNSDIGSKQNSFLRYQKTDSVTYQNSLITTDSAIDITPYLILRAKTGYWGYNSARAGYISLTVTSSKGSSIGGLSAYRDNGTADAPNNMYVDVSSINEAKYLGFGWADRATVNFDVKEMWLE